MRSVEEKGKEKKEKEKEKEKGERGGENGMLCVVCLSERRNIMFRPCNHVAVCSKCDKEMRRGGNGRGVVICCICRSPLEKSEKMLFP